ncbi:DUF6210 family protein [Kitasatospora griseola]
MRLDEIRLDRADEAWVPVLTPDGPAVPVWSNSDWPAEPQLRTGAQD